MNIKREVSRRARGSLLRVLTAGSLLGLGGIACEGRPLDDGNLGAGEGEDSPSFMAINRGGGDAGENGQVAVRASQLVHMPSSDFDPGQSFYLAIHRRELGRRYFMSAYLKQYFPGAVLSGAARTLGTRVVSFKIQNGKLFVLDVDDRKAASDTFTQDVIVDAYPIVNTRNISGAPRLVDDYVVIDPAAGLNRFGVVGDFFGSGGRGLLTRFRVELAMSQRFRRLPDGATFEQVFTGFTEQPINNRDRVETNFFRASGVLGLAFRRYQEGEGYAPTPPPPVVHYFLSPPSLVRNQGTTRQFVAKWNIRPGMKPIRWLVSPQVAEAQKDPEVVEAGIDLFAAIKAGIESWNAAFGFPVVEAVMASPNDSFADDDKNYFIYDRNPAVGFAFANWRTNPNNGETLGASVFFSHTFVENAIANFPPETTATPPAGGAGLAARGDDLPAPATRTPPPVTTLTWEPLNDGEPPCTLTPRALDPVRLELRMGTPGTRKDAIEKAIASTAAHEVGHTLGLRHNFKGSLVPPSSSVMDYFGDDLAAAADIPGPYDIAAVRALYGLAPALPTQPFCNDSGVDTDARCDVFDETADPLPLFHAPPYIQVVNLFLDLGFGIFGQFADIFMADLVRYARLGSTPAERFAAWRFIVDELEVPVPAARVNASPVSVIRGVNLLTIQMMRRLMPEPPAPGSAAAAQPPPRPLDPAIVSALLTELRGNLLNLDNIRTFDNRRLCVDTLKRVQSAAAHAILREAQTTVRAQSMASTSAPEKALLDDLAARIDRAVTPYYDR